MSCFRPGGSFYLFPNLSHYLKKANNGTTVNNSLDLAVCLINEAKITLVPCSTFGAEGYLSISYAASLERLSETVHKLKNTLNKLN